MSDRCQSAGATNLHFDVLEQGGCLTGSVLEGNGPTRRFGRPAELLLLGDGIDFRDDAVGFVGEGIAFGVPLPNEPQQLVEISAFFAVRIYLKSGGGERLQTVPMARQHGLAVL